MGIRRGDRWTRAVDVRRDGVAALVDCADRRGLHDMLGNAWELTSDAWSTVDFKAPGSRVIKGGSFLCSPDYCARYRPEARQPQEDDLPAGHIGFRTVLNLPRLH